MYPFRVPARRCRDFFMPSFIESEIIGTWRCPCLPQGLAHPRIFRYKITEGRGGGKHRYAWPHGKRPAAFRNLCQIGYSVRFPLAMSAFCHFKPSVWVSIVKIPRMREAVRLQTRGKRIKNYINILKLCSALFFNSATDR